jgi:hypothetical protein
MGPLVDAGVADAVRSLQELIEADGGAIEFLEFKNQVLRLRLVLDGVSCEECILPPEMLRQVAWSYVHSRAPGVGGVELDDPREQHSPM